MKKYSVLSIMLFLLVILSMEASAQEEKHKHYKFVYVQNFFSPKYVLFGISEDGKKYEEVKVERATSSSGTDFNEAIKLIQKHQDEGWTLNRAQHIDEFKMYLIFEK